MPIFIVNVMISTRGVKTGTYANKYKTLTKKIGLIISLVSSMFLFIAFIYPEYLSQDALSVDAAFKREFEMEGDSLIVEQSYLIPKNAKASVIIMDEVATIMAEYNETRQSLPAEIMSAEKLNYFKEMKRWVAVKSQEVEEIQKKVDCETTFFKIYIVLKIISQGLYIAESVTELRKQRNRLRNSK